MEKPVNTDRINQDYYEPLFSHATNRILFTNGSQDPWSRLSIVNEGGLEQRQQKQPRGVNSGLTLYKIQGAAHCEDLHRSGAKDSDALKGARGLAAQLIEEWLK